MSRKRKQHTDSKVIYDKDLPSILERLRIILGPDCFIMLQLGTRGKARFHSVFNPSETFEDQDDGPGLKKMKTDAKGVLNYMG
jgi:hypothetical protein